MFQNVRIFGLLAPIAVPICYLAKLTHQWETPPMIYDEAEPEHEWLRTEFCTSCQFDTDHEWKQWLDEQVVTRECLECEKQSFYWDDK